jgi:hypothetical protein
MPPPLPTPGAYPVGTPLRPPPGWRGPRPAAGGPGSGWGFLLTTVALAVLVVVCMAVGWVAVQARRPAPRPERASEKAPAEGPPATERPPALLTFEKDVLPLLRQSCTRCHEPGKKRGELDLTTYRAALRGGENGPGVKPGRPDDSLL